MSSAVRVRRAGRLHDVAEHHPDDHVDGGVEVLARPAPTSYGATRSATTALAAPSSELGVRGQQRQQLGVGAVGGGDDRVQQRVVLGELEHVARRAPRIAPTRSSGWASKARFTTPRNRSSSCRIIASASAGLGADLVVDGLPADADPVGEPWPS